jgi:fumarylacetoacetase
LPFAFFRRKNSDESYRGGVAIGDQVVDLQAVNEANLFSSLAQEAVVAFTQSSLNAYMSMGKSVWSALRSSLSQRLRTGADIQNKMATCLVSQSDVEYNMPCQIGDYRDF